MGLQFDTHMLYSQAHTDVADAAATSRLLVMASKHLHASAWGFIVLWMRTPLSVPPCLRAD